MLRAVTLGASSGSTTRLVVRTDEAAGRRSDPLRLPDREQSMQVGGRACLPPGLSSIIAPFIASAFAAHPVSAEAVTIACSLLRLRRCDHAARKRPHPCYCMAFAEAVRIDRFRDTPTVVVPAQTMNCPPISRLACRPEGFRPVCMRHALGVLADRGIGAFAIERRSTTPIARDCSCRTPSARPRSGR